ncbi:MAG: IMP dehydrogenase [Lachnospirales bacterium]
MEKYYTFDDVLLLPSYSEVLPRDVSIETKLTKNISLKSPIMSAAMDTVTESAMAIQMALNGGIGVVHKNMSIEEQREQVERVKKYELLVNKDPFYINEEDTLYNAVDMLERYDVSSLMVVDEEHTLKGIISKKDLKFIDDFNCKVKDKMTKNVVKVNSSVSYDEAEEIIYSSKLTKIPVIDEENKLKGLVTLDTLKKYNKYGNKALDKEGRLLVAAAVSVNEKTMDRVDALVKGGADAIVIDSAHGFSKSIIEVTKSIKEKYNVDIIVGNVVNEESIEVLAKAGADAIKVGIGSGSICTTRIISGVGAPQFTAIEKCVKEANKYGVSIIADGGIRYSGDVVKALAIGASAVMLGSLLAGHDESPGELINVNGKLYKSYVGMGSMVAMERGGGDRYFQSKVKKYVPEGIEAVKEYKGSTDDTLYQLLGGIRTGCGYLGAENIDALVKNARFIEISAAGSKESHPHTISVVKDAPNYTSN